MSLSSATLTFIVLESLPYYIQISPTLTLTVRHRPNDHAVLVEVVSLSGLHDLGASVLIIALCHAGR